MKAQQPFEGGNMVTDALFSPRVYTLSSLLQINSFPLFHPTSIYLAYMHTEKIYTLHIQCMGNKNK